MRCHAQHCGCQQNKDFYRQDRIGNKFYANMQGQKSVCTFQSSLPANVQFYLTLRYHKFRFGVCVYVLRNQKSMNQAGIPEQQWEIRTKK